MTIRLIGLNHRYQLRGYAGADWSAFERYLLSYSANKGVDLLAEELSDEAVRKWKAEDSVARHVARCLSVRHLFCDPGVRTARSTRHPVARRDCGELGPRPTVDLVEATEREDWRVREQHWLNTLRNVSFTTCVFILGSQHVESFETFLLSERCDAAIVEKNWEP